MEIKKPEQIKKVWLKPELHEEDITETMSPKGVNIREGATTRS